MYLEGLDAGLVLAVVLVLAGRGEAGDLQELAVLGLELAYVREGDEAVRDEPLGPTWELPMLFRLQQHGMRITGRGDGMRPPPPQLR
jgi:hypothetical protein